MEPEDELRVEAECDAPEEEAAPEVVWPPRVEEPPPLPYTHERLELSIDESAVPPPEPEFTPSKLTHAKPSVGGGPPEASRVVPYDRKNPSGRTRADAVLRPTDEDRDMFMREQTVQAAIAGAAAAFTVMLVFGNGPWWAFAAVTTLGALAGALACRLGDTTWSWMPCLTVVGLPMALTRREVLAYIIVCIMAWAGWVIGLARETRH